MSDFFVMGMEDWCELADDFSKIPVCVCLDVRASMRDCLGALEDGVNEFYDAVRKCDETKDSCEIAVVTFGDTVQVLEDYSTVDKKLPLKLTASGKASLAEGVEKSLEILEARKNYYKENGIDYYQPWLIIMSNGELNSREAIKTVQESVKELENQKKLVVISLGVGDGAAMDVMDGFSRKKAKKLKRFHFSEAFEWHGQVLIENNMGADPCEKIKLDSVDDWYWLDSDGSDNRSDDDCSDGDCSDGGWSDI